MSDPSQGGKVQSGVVFVQKVNGDMPNRSL